MCSFCTSIISQNILNSSQILEEYLIAERFDWIILDYKSSGGLTEYGRQQLVNSMVDFMYMFFEVKTIQKPHKMMTLSALLQMFPNLAPPGMVDHFMVNSILILQLKNFHMNIHFALRIQCVATWRTESNS